MSMETYVLGFKPADDKFKKMKEVYLKCGELGIDPPREVEDYFDGSGVVDGGVRVEIEEHECCSEYSDGCRNGFEIDVTKLPKDVKIVRFYNSY